MNEKLFRRSSLSRVNSPEQLNEYIRVANPGVWLLLAAIICLLSGALTWGVFGIVETKVPACIVVSDGEAAGYISEDRVSLLEEGMTFTVGSYTGSILSIGDKPVRAGDKANSYLLYQAGLSEDDYCYEVELRIDDMPDGAYAEELTVERIHPISFIAK